MSNTKMKQIKVIGRNVGEFVQTILDKVNEGYIYDRSCCYKVGYIHYTDMKLSEPVKKSNASKTKKGV